MHTPKSFRDDLELVYNGNLDIAKLFTTHKNYIQSLGAYALRYKSYWTISDQDDLYQEACYWITRLLWEYDESRDVDLTRYVIYNVGVRLCSVVRFEKNIKRHPPKGCTTRIDVWQNTYDDGNNKFEEVYLKDNCVDIETSVAVREALANADAKLSQAAWELTVALIREGGNLTAATRTLLRSKEIRRRFGTDVTNVRYALQTKVLPEIFKFFNPADIMPV